MALDEAGVRAALLNSCLSSADAAAVERRMRGRRARPALHRARAADERALSRLLDDVHELRIALFAIDEAHCVSQWGHDFRPEYGSSPCCASASTAVPRIALTATADAPTRRDDRRPATH